MSDKLKVAFEAGRGRTYREIEENTGISKSSVGRIISLMKNDHIETGKIDMISPLRYHFVAMHLLDNPFNTYGDISRLSNEFEFKMSISTVSRIARAMGFKARYQQPKEKLTEAQKRYRIEFATNIKKTFYFMLPWCFSDESMLCLEPYRKKIRIIPSVQCEEQFFEKQGYPIKVMVWGCIAKNFKSELLKIEGKLDANSYQKLLADNKIIEKLDKRFGKFGYIFQEDGASPHRAKSTRAFLKNQVVSLPAELHWPSSSPDLNVIEICWAMVKSHIDATSISSAQDLYHAAVQAWNAIPQESINSLIDSFDTRLTTCIKIGGNSLNGKKKLMKLYKISIQAGDNYLQQIQQNTTKLRDFIRRSRIFFNQLKNLDLTENQINRLNCNESRKICNLLPDKIKKKTGLPKPILTGS